MLLLWRNYRLPYIYFRADITSFTTFICLWVNVVSPGMRPLYVVPSMRIVQDIVQINSLF